MGDCSRSLRWQLYSYFKLGKWKQREKEQKLTTFRRCSFEQSNGKVGENLHVHMQIKFFEFFYLNFCYDERGKGRWRERKTFYFELQILHKVWKFLKDLNFELPCNLTFPQLKEAMRRRNHVLIFVNLEIRVFGVLNKLNKIMYL